jgi:hypothetical protein
MCVVGGGGKGGGSDSAGEYSGMGDDLKGLACANHPLDWFCEADALNDCDMRRLREAPGGSSSSSLSSSNLRYGSSWLPLKCGSSPSSRSELRADVREPLSVVKEKKIGWLLDDLGGRPFKNWEA